jgi:hypothetical protein
MPISDFSSFEQFFDVDNAESIGLLFQDEELMTQIGFDSDFDIA